jgi:hypothetical protein
MLFAIIAPTRVPTMRIHLVPDYEPGQKFADHGRWFQLIFTNNPQKHEQA